MALFQTWARVDVGEGMDFDILSFMKLVVILSSSNAETNWNALRIANLAIKKGDEVDIFLLGEGVEYLKFSSDKFDIQKQVDAFLESDRAKITACGTCLEIRGKDSGKACPVGNLEDWYRLIAESDKVLTF
ncbi:MAG: hypothetical protein UT84_C0003G0008 [Candidatus Curtissbacteria bacterium GW2011_GWA1_40_16]|uniref:Uncharacterized protein n=1 Tax=Candidatus Curtissbacteria bacterium GW2011_GWA1_40_16 TaxID=1618405 RepID=A0A0G0REY8_9BACT|nr:MAG: hypothetical protein UT84_C0003G0008 [Candidatus Curtissbacteria bacterium GW2011_GWA1_40_16]